MAARGDRTEVTQRAALVVAAALAAAGCRQADADPPPSPWEPLVVDGRPGCQLSVPRSAAALPAPLRWEACAADLPGCRQLVIDWDHPGNPGIGRAPRLWVDPRGVAHVLLTRVAVAGGGGPGSYLEWLVAEVDGPVEFAMRMPVDGEWRCVASEQDLDEGRFAIRLRGDGTGPGMRSDAEALLVGEIGRLRPEVVVRDETPSTASWSVGAAWLVRGAAPERELFVHAADGGPALPLRAPDGARPAGGLPQVVGDEVVWELEGGRGLMAWDEQRGAHPLTRGEVAGNLGTDGRHLVWTRVEGERRSIVAADYTSDPDALRPRPLRADGNPILGAHAMRFAVGCGFAGRNAMPPRDLQIVRIADGAGWRLAAAPGWSWGQVLGFTCDEVFATVFSRAQGVSIARVRLDSLKGSAP
jgi:hypothetical protein